MSARGDRTSGDLETDLRRVVLEDLTRRGLDDPQRLAQALGIMPSTARGLLERDHWTLHTCRWVASKLAAPQGQAREAVATV